MNYITEDVAYFMPEKMQEKVNNHLELIVPTPSLSPVQSERLKETIVQYIDSIIFDAYDKLAAEDMIEDWKVSTEYMGKGLGRLSRSLVKEKGQTDLTYQLELLAAQMEGDKNVQK
tara:strand:+ start:876 stop:1223 length:348 start_codon:yes stop_codon:yes gene_type:complete